MKRYPCSVTCTVTFQYAFEQSEMRLDLGGAAKNAEPTEEALENLESELAVYLGINYAIDDLDIDEGSVLLLGINDDSD